MLEKVFINKNFTQFKTSRTVKIDALEILDKNVGKLFSKYELLFFDQASFSSYPSKILILQFLIPRAFLPPLPSLSNLTLANWDRSLLQSLRYSSSVSLFYTTSFDHTDMCKYWICQTICQAKSVEFVIKLYTNHNTLWVKLPFSKLDNTVNSNFIFNTNYAEFSSKW